MLKLRHTFDIAMAEADPASEDEPQERVDRGGYGMLHNYCFKPAIEEAINQTADVFPEQVLRGTYKAAEIAAVLQTFGRHCQTNAERIYLALPQKDGTKDHKVIKKRCQGFKDAIIKLCKSTYHSKGLPKYFVTAIRDMKQPRLKALLARCVIVRQNHRYAIKHNKQATMAFNEQYDFQVFFRAQHGSQAHGSIQSL
jgi:hypothetical protein